MSGLAARLEQRAPALPVALGVTTITLALVLGVAVAVDPRSASLLAAAVLAPVLIWADTRVALALFAFSLGINLDVVTSPVHVSLPQLAGLALLAGALVRARTPAMPGGLRAQGGLLFVLCILPSLIGAVSRADAVSGLLKLVVAALLLRVATRAFTDQPEVGEKVAAWLVVGAVLSVVPAAAQVGLGIGPDAYRVGGVMRAYSTFGQPNTYGMYLAGVLPLAAGLGLRPRRRGFLIAAAVIALGIALSGSRGAWAGAAIGMLALYAAVARLRASVIAGGLFGAAALVGFAFLLPREWILGRFDLTDWSTQQRLLILLTAWDGITRSPLLGYGPGSFEAMLPGIARPGLLDDVATPHNVLLHIWFEHGLAALLCFTVLLAAYACTTLRAARRTRDPRLAGLFGGVLGMIAAAMFGTLFIRGVQETFILLIAITAALLHGSLVSRGVSGHANPVSV